MSATDLMSEEIDLCIAAAVQRLHERRIHAQRVAQAGRDAEGALAVVARMERALELLYKFNATKPYNSPYKQMRVVTPKTLLYRKRRAATRAAALKRREKAPH